MKSLHRFVLGMCCVALSLLGFSTVASAHDFGVVHQFRHAVASVGEYDDFRIQWLPSGGSDP